MELGCHPMDAIPILELLEQAYLQQVFVGAQGIELGYPKPWLSTPELPPCWPPMTPEHKV